MNVHDFIEKIARQSDAELAQSYRKRKKLARQLSTAGSIGMVGSIPVGILGRGPIGAATSTGMALGGALSYLGGMAADASANSKLKKILRRQRQQGEMYNAQRSLR